LRFCFFFVPRLEAAFPQRGAATGFPDTPLIKKRNGFPGAVLTNPAPTNQEVEEWIRKPGIEAKSDIKKNDRDGIHALRSDNINEACPFQFAVNPMACTASTRKSRRLPSRDTDIKVRYFRSRCCRFAKKSAKKAKTEAPTFLYSVDIIRCRDSGKIRVSGGNA
jgi:hypothetical protein